MENAVLSNLPTSNVSCVDVNKRTNDKFNISLVVLFTSFPFFLISKTVEACGFYYVFRQFSVEFIGFLQESIFDESSERFQSNITFLNCLQVKL